MVIFFCLFCDTHTSSNTNMYHQQTHRTAKSNLTARSATNADTKFCAPMPCKSLASRKRPPRSSWTQSIWRVINTAWVTPRYRTPTVVHVVIVSRRANAIALSKFFGAESSLLKVKIEPVKKSDSIFNL